VLCAFIRHRRASPTLAQGHDIPDDNIPDDNIHHDYLVFLGSPIGDSESEKQYCMQKVDEIFDDLLGPLAQNCSLYSKSYGCVDIRASIIYTELSIQKTAGNRQSILQPECGN
jgi:hypothetical protein